MQFLASLLVLECLCLVGVLADYYLKLAGDSSDFIDYRKFIIGFLLHSSTAIGWFFVLKYMKLVQVGAIYSVSIILLLAAVGVFRFGETLQPREVVGIGLAIVSVMLLADYA